jgi:hypothetical protein
MRCLESTATYTKVDMHNPSLHLLAIPEPTRHRHKSRNGAHQQHQTLHKDDVYCPVIHDFEIDQL